MPPRLLYEPLALKHIDELAAVLLHEPVYRHLGGVPPSVEKFRLGLERSLAGAPADLSGEVWLIFLVRRESDGAVLGRLEATVHDGIAEVAFLFGPQYWGHGYATEGLLWLHEILLARPDCRALWATTVPENLRCRSLLARCGYREATDERPGRLVSFDDGDLVFCGPGVG